MAAIDTMLAFSQGARGTPDGTHSFTARASLFSCLRLD